MPLVYIGLGSNLGDREATIRRALALLESERDVTVVRVSTLRETDPVGCENQPRFLNGAAEISTELAPRELLERLQRIEQELGRDRSGPRFGPRTIDLDLLLYGGEQIAEKDLEIPHPRMAERRFVLEPLAELDAGLDVPGRGRVRDLVAGLR